MYSSVTRVAGTRGLSNSFMMDGATNTNANANVTFINPSIDLIEEFKIQRNTFNADLKTPGSAAQAEKWQKIYVQGKTESGAVEAAEDHRTKLRLNPFRKAK